MTEPEPHRRLKRVVKYGIIPAIIGVLVAGVLVLRAVAINDSITASRKTACNAVDESNGANLALWAAAIQGSDSRNSPAALAFLVAYAKSNDHIHQECLAGHKVTAVVLPPPPLTTTSHP